METCGLPACLVLQPSSLVLCLSLIHNSAGITMATAIFSAVTGEKVRGDLAMTGEVTLRGGVLPIGGLKEKLLAAKMAGVTEVLVPFENKKDVEEISEEIREGLTITFVKSMKEVLEHALVNQGRK